jgi:glucoamylase
MGEMERMTDQNNLAPGQPGIPPSWTSSAKGGVGTSLNPSSRVWFTLSHGIFDEIYYPRVDQACTRDMGMLVSDGDSYFSEEKRDANHKIEYLATGVPAYRLTNTAKDGRYQIVKEILSDPQRDVVLQKTTFKPLKGSLKDYHLYVLLSPHLGNHGTGNHAWVGDYKGTPMLFAEREANALALASNAPYLGRSVGYVGHSDGWQDISEHKRMTWSYSNAPDGNVALTAEIDLLARNGEFVLALGFGTNFAEAGQRALSSLMDGFGRSRKTYLDEWMKWQKSVSSRLELDGRDQSVFRISAAVLRIHEAKRFPGGLIASLAIPWGFSKGDDDLGGYHLVWPRDLVESAGGLLAIGALEDARRVLDYLYVTQEAPGCWPQNMWLDGRPYWEGIQMDETAFPILLIGLARSEGALDEKDMSHYWPMACKAAGFLARNGPVTQQDRWEEDPGYSPFTLAAEIAAMLVAADLAEEQGEKGMANYLRQTADIWNDHVEQWTYVQGTDLAKEYQVDGYYVRIAPPEVSEAASPTSGFVAIKNRPPGQSNAPASHIISPDFLALVRFGLRAPNDPRICNTIKIVDSTLKIDTPVGPIWHRYSDDGYGEHDDGSPFDGTGVGRAWPLLTGERGHYELAAKRTEEARRHLRAMEGFANSGDMIPEQVWDSDDIPERELFFGKPSGSAMPLVWAHAEFAKLSRSIQDGKVFDMPAQTYARYVQKKTTSTIDVWRFNHKCQGMKKGNTLRIEVLSPALIHWSADGWKSTKDVKTKDSGLGVYYADIPTKKLPAGASVVFTIFWPEEERWQGADFHVQIGQ